MPYKTNSDLPESVKHVLPAHAQDIYRAAFNHALTEYKEPKTHHTKGDSAEEVAHKVAWAAVKKKYHKVEDTWKPLAKK